MAKKKKQIDTNGLKEYNLIDNVFFNAAEEKKKEENELKKYQIKKLSPFDVINMMYLNPSGFAQIKDELLEEYYFIINRRFAIMYPQQAAMMSRLKINQVAAVKFWANFARAMNRGRPGVPQWINTKGAKAMKDSRPKVSIDAFDEEIISKYMNAYDLSARDLKDMLHFFNEETIADIEKYFETHDPKQIEKLYVKSKGTKKDFENDD